MAEATIKLGNGTTVAISGSPEEIARVISLYNEGSKNNVASTGGPRPRKTSKVDRSDDQRHEFDLSFLINTINDCDESDSIEKIILDNNDVVNRLLMPLYINEKYFESEPKLTTGDISKILKQLGTPISTPNVSIAISRKAKSYVMTDSVRKKGAVVRYAINRRGKQYFENVLSGNAAAPDRRATTPISKPKKTKEPVSEKSDGKSSENTKSTAYKPKYNSALDLLKLEDFFKAYTLNNNSEYVVAFFKFLNEEINLSAVDGNDIYTCFVELKSHVKLPGSFMNTLRNAQNRDHIISYDRGFTNIKLTPKGENLFNHDVVKRKVD